MLARRWGSAPKPPRRGGGPAGAAARALCHMGWTRMMNMLHSGKVEDHGIQVSSLSEQHHQGSREAHP